MKRLDPPNIDSVAMVDQLVAERAAGANAAFFAGCAQEWRARVQTYLVTRGDPLANSRWPTADAQKTSFLTLYNSPQPGHVQESLLDDMRNNHRLNECPACGDRGSLGTLDHYLPKEDFPHFSVLLHNLAPMCGICQTAKGRKTGDASTGRLFLHPYFDNVADQQLLKLTIGPPFDSPAHVLEVDGAAAGTMLPTVIHHLRELEVHPRFSRYFATAYPRLLRNCQELRYEGEEVLSNLRSFRRAARAGGLNTWDHVFYDGVLNNPDLTSYLQHTTLPAFL